MEVDGSKCDSWCMFAGSGDIGGCWSARETAPIIGGCWSASATQLALHRYSQAWRTIFKLIKSIDNCIVFTTNTMNIYFA